MYSFCVILQMRFTNQKGSAFRVGALNRGTVWMMAEMFDLEVFFQVAAAREGPQASFRWQAFIAKAENTLGGLALDLNKV